MGHIASQEKVTHLSSDLCLYLL